jgi:hypothetical protein
VPRCAFPKEHQNGFYPCGNCRFCRRNLQRTWAARIQLEAFYHPYSVFCTFTYNDDALPLDREGVPILHKPDIIKFREKLRWLTKPIRPLRYFMVGEYGDKTWRPHYHAIFFGLGVQHEPLISRAWHEVSQDSFTEVAYLTPERSAYIAQYTLKKLTKDGDHYLKGRPPEFAQMSTKPAIGTPAIGWLADTMGKSSLMQDGKYGPLLKVHGDVFNHVRINGRVLPLGRMMRSKLREALGLSDNPRERAHQLGRFDYRGEIFEETILDQFYPSTDIKDIASPWRNYEEKQAHRAAQEKTDAYYAKEARQGLLPGLSRRI